MLLLDDSPTQLIMVSYFRPNDFKKSVESIIKNTICPFNLTIIDNSHGGLDKELNAISDKRITIYKNSRNIGKGAAINERFDQIIKKNTSVDHFVSIDSDVIVPNGWLFELKKAYFAVQKRDNPAIIAPAIINTPESTWEKQIESKRLDMHQYGNLKMVDYYNGLYYNRYIAGPLLLINLKFFKSVGLYHDKQLYGVDDGKLCKAAHNMKHFIGINSNVKIIHSNEDSTIEYVNWKKRNITMDVDQCGHWD